MGLDLVSSSWSVGVVDVFEMDFSCCYCWFEMVCVCLLFIPRYRMVSGGVEVVSVFKLVR